MARPKRSTTSRSRSESAQLASRSDDTTFADAMTTSPTMPRNLMRAFMGLGALFFVMWILIGAFFLLVIFQNFRSGAYKGLFSSQTDQAQQSPTDVQRPTEVNLPGIGMVNIACVQEALSPESIQKVIQEKKIDVLQGDERAKFEKCITAPESGSPAPAATPAGQ